MLYELEKHDHIDVYIQEEPIVIYKDNTKGKKQARIKTFICSEHTNASNHSPTYTVMNLGNVIWGHLANSREIVQWFQRR